MRRQGTPSRGTVPAQGMAEQGGAGDGKQRPLVPRSRSLPRLTPGELLDKLNVLPDWRRIVGNLIRTVEQKIH